MTNRVDKARHTIAESLGNEAKALNESPGLNDLFQQRQALLANMAQACKNAVEKAKQPFIDELERIEKEYAMLLQLVGDNKEKR